MTSDAPAPGPAPAPRLRGPVLWLGSMAGTGLSPWFPGSCGSIAALLVVAFLPDPIYAPACLALALIATLTGPRLAERFIAASGRHDPQSFVFDEAAGLWLACLRPEHPGVFSLLTSLVLFRAFDMAKPWPISRIERLPGGVGVVYDDVAAGAIALAIAWPLHVYLP